MTKLALSKHIKGHEPVLLKEILEQAPFSPLGEGKKMLDATFGCGGHTKAFLSHFPQLLVTAIDRDIQAIRWGQTHVLPFLPKKSYLKLYHTNFCPYFNLMQKLNFSGENCFDMILLDLGVSSLQLDQAERGFSFYKDGPLDMRMDQAQSLCAHDIINQASERELKNMFFCYEEIYTKQNEDWPPKANIANPFLGLAKKDKNSNVKQHQTNQTLSVKPTWNRHKNNKVVKAILRERKKKAIESTKELSDMIIKQKGWRKQGQHPATAYFLALRLKVNKELEALAESLPGMIKSLKHGGRICVLTFHSVEDRIVKNIFKNSSKGQVFKKALRPSREEIQKNPRARSAKLRVFEKN